MEAMFSGRHTLKKVKDKVSGQESIFVDRDADVFSMVVSYLRNGLKYPTIDDKVMNDRFRQELHYWMLEEPKRVRESVSEQDIDELAEVFNQVTEYSNQNLKERWTYHGVFDLKKAITDGKIEVDERLLIFNGLKTKDNFIYFGQSPTYHCSFIGKEEGGSQLYEGVFHYNEETGIFVLDGYGRFIGQNTFYEGFWKNDKKHGRGRMIKHNGDVLEGEWQNNQFLG